MHLMPTLALRQNHYYPFGLTMQGISSKAAGSLINRNKFNEGTELQNQEFSDGNGLELYATNFRSLDPQIGRFWQVDALSEASYENSQYAYASNNPVLRNDPSGLKDTVFKTLAPVVVTSAKGHSNVSVAKLTHSSVIAAPGIFTKPNYIKGNPLRELIASGPRTLGPLAKIYIPHTEAIIFPIGGFFRGGGSIIPRRGVDYKVGADGFVTGRGPSVNTNAFDPNVVSRGVYTVQSIPQGLKAINTGGTHFEIVPAYPMNEATYLNLMKQVVLSNVNKIGYLPN
jgi:RHS repeat-associated protein